MKIAVIGTGIVGQTLAAKLHSLGHEVMIGTRNMADALARTENDRYGNPGFGEWYKKNNGIKLGTIAEAAAFGEILINATPGADSVHTFRNAKAADLSGKIILDLANPLDFSQGMPPRLIPALSNDNSLGEELQKAFPGARVVKTLNTMWCGLMVNPAMIGGGDHTNFVCGNDKDAKDRVKSLLREFGWQESSLLDLGDISASRGTEAVLPIWLRLMMTKQTAAFNFNIIG